MQTLTGKSVTIEGKRRKPKASEEAIMAIARTGASKLAIQTKTMNEKY